MEQTQGSMLKMIRGKGLKYMSRRLKAAEDYQVRGVELGLPEQAFLFLVMAVLLTGVFYAGKYQQSIKQYNNCMDYAYSKQLTQEEGEAICKKFKENLVQSNAIN